VQESTARTDRCVISCYVQVRLLKPAKYRQDAKCTSFYHVPPNIQVYQFNQHVFEYQ